MDIERGNGAVGRTQETVGVNAAHVRVTPCDRPRRVDAFGKCACGPWWIECDECGLGVKQGVVAEIQRAIAYAASQQPG